jgi:tripartite ATP-independent transporter DctM subunit
MTPIAIGTLGLIVLVVLLVLRVPIGAALASVSIAGIWMIRGERPALTVLGNIPYDFISKWTLSAVPMFILMGAIASHTGLTRSLFSAARLWMGRLPGGLAVATNVAGAGFAAASGSSLATTASMARIAVPEMLRLKYEPGLATGVAAAVGTLGALIPPSIIMVIYAVFAEISVGKMLIGGLIPGIITAIAYASLIIVRASINPELAPALPKGSVTWRERWESLLHVWPLPLLVFGVVGGIYSGLVTATEAGAIGAALAILIGLLQRTMTWTVLKDSLVETARTTAMIFFIVIGASLFATFLSLSQLPGVISAMVLETTDNPLIIVLIAAAIYLVLGCFLDSVGVLLLTLPVLLPIFDAAGIHPIWVGVILVKFLEIGLLTPPVGLNVFVVKGVLGDQVTLGTIFRGVSWFLLAEAVVMTLLIAFPDIILFLPNLVQ